MKNKILFCLLVITLMMIFIPLTSSAKTTGGEFNSATKDPNGNNYICEWIFDDTSGELNINGTGKLSDYSVGKFPWEAYREDAEHLVVENVSSIGKRGFASHTNLETVSLPSNLEYVGMRAFEYCSSLEEIVIPGSVKGVYDQAFLECTSLRKVVFEDGIDMLYTYMFGNCHNLEEVYVYGEETKISRMRSNEDDGVWFRGITDFGNLTVYCYEGSDADDYFSNDIYTITNWVNDHNGNEATQSFEKKENSMTAGGYVLNVEYY